MEEQLKSQVRNSFVKLKNAIDLREKLLLRQIDVLKLKNISNNNFSDISFITLNEEETLNLLRNYGVYQNLDTFLPFLENENENEEEENINYNKCITDLDCLDNKILSESIINLTVKESADLISKSNDLKLKSVDLVEAVNQKLKNILPSVKMKQQNNIDKTKQALAHDKNKEEETKSIKQSEKGEKEKTGKDEAGGKFLKRNNGTTTSSKKKVLKNISNLTLNNCGTGNIILKNISNLTINTCKQLQKSVAVVDDDSRVCKVESKSCMEDFSPPCEFYEKLISENEALKRTIVHQSVKCTTFPDPITAVCMSPTSVKQNDETYSITNESASSIADELEDGFPSFKKSAELKLDSPIDSRSVYLAESFLNQPPIIQSWLSNLDTEVENNVEILEFSNIA